MMLKLFEKVQQLKARTKAVYIYGFGTYGHNVYGYLKRNGVCIDGFVVTKKCDADVADIPIVEIAEILNANVGIILGLGSYNSLQVSKFLDTNNFNKNNIIDGGKELDNGGIRLGSTGMPVLEITTKVGCAVNCKYCPQSVFLEKYYENDNRIKYNFLNSNNGISENTNEAIKMATGDFIGFLDHDDIIPKEALFEIVKVINVTLNFFDII